MATTDAQRAAARALGFTTPAGDDLIAYGDDAISDNAAITAQLIKALPTFADVFEKGAKWSATDDLNSWWKAGAWGITGAKGMPPGVSSAMMLQVEAGSKAWQRLWVTFGVQASLWLQWGNQVRGEWYPATPLDVTTAPDSALMHHLHVQDLRRRRQRRAKAPAVVALVLDHGYRKFMEVCWPDLLERGIPVTWALNTVHPAAIDTGDDGLDWDAIKALAAAHPDTLELAAHSSNHGNQYDRLADLSAAIVDHKQQLSELTGQRIDTWVQPGATLGAFVKDNPGTPADYGQTRAGRLIAAHYAAATGYIQSPRTFRLDGEPDLGIVGNWLDLGPGNVMTYVNAVVTNGGYTVLRLHPQYLDAAGYITRAAWTGLLDELVSLREAGRLELMTFRDASVALPPSSPEPAAWETVPLTAATGGELRMKRDGNRVQYSLTNFRPGATGTVKLCELPAKFRPAETALSWASENETPRPLYALDYAPYALEVRRIGSATSWVNGSGAYDAANL